MCHDGIIASTSEVLMMKIAQMEVEPSTVAQMETIASEVAEHEACHDEIIACTNDVLMMVPLKIAQMKVEPNPVAQMETIASTSEAVKVSEHEACLHESGPVVAEHEAVCSFYAHVFSNGNVLSPYASNNLAVYVFRRNPLTRTLVHRCKGSP
jgi:hypothetical protein